MNTKTSRIYPMCCTSAYCGKCGDECLTCENKPILDEFNSWCRETGARCVDPIWSPLVYEVPARDYSQAETDQVLADMPKPWALK